MMHTALQKMLGWPPPAWVRKAEVAAILGVFAEAFDVDPPALEDRPADQCLPIFREFTAACMEEALKGGEAALPYRDRLGAGGFRLGSQMRAALRVSAASAFPFAQFLYRGIGIELTRDESGCLRFGPCSFSQRYSPMCCMFMSAFDEGFLRGLLGIDARLVFSCRLTEGAPCCLASFE
ncbi:MAG: hypothetical protein IJI68_02250 [Eggerthellaceae bacterium]|nr:hypothetical protein [Eggerthellaceae bacterium]